MALVTARLARPQVVEKARLIIKTDPAGLTFSATYAPREVEYSGFEAIYQEVERPGRKPLLRKSGEALRRISMEIFVGSKDIETSVSPQIRLLERLAESPLPLVIEYEPRTYGRWRIEALSYSSVDRTTSGNQISRALVSIDFVEIPPKKKNSNRE